MCSFHSPHSLDKNHPRKKYDNCKETEKGISSEKDSKKRARAQAQIKFRQHKQREREKEIAGATEAYLQLPEHERATPMEEGERS